jgi:hypothetical protein
MSRWFLDTDNDGHWYIVRVKHSKEWDKWLKLDPSDEKSWNHPWFATPVGGAPQRVTFEDPVIE